MKLSDALTKYGDRDVKEELFENMLEPEKIKTVWDLKEGDKYCVICNTGQIMHCEWYCGNTDKERRNQGNIFLTDEEALKESKRRLFNAKAQKFTSRNGDNTYYEWYYYINMDCVDMEGDDNILIAQHSDRKVPNVIYFENKQDIEEFLTPERKQEILELWG